MRNIIMAVFLVFIALSNSGCERNIFNKLLISIENGALYPGGWSDDGETVYATLHREDTWQIIRINATSGQYTPVDVGLDGAGVGDVHADKLVIESVEQGGSDIYIYDLETRQLEQLTDTERYEWHPVFSPDGSAVAYDIQTGEGPDIYRHALSDGAMSEIAGQPESEQAARFSPDGSRIAFHRRNGGDNGSIDMVVRDLDSGGEQSFAVSDYEDSYPNWHPNGDRVVFTSNRNGSFDLFIYCFEQDAVIQLTEDPDNEKYPKWSPDGQSILYQSDRENGAALYLTGIPASLTCKQTG